MKAAQYACGFLMHEGTERSVLLDWLLNHRRLITLVFCLLIVALIALIVTFMLLSGRKTFIDAWYV
jgi:hypothetical protein